MIAWVLDWGGSVEGSGTMARPGRGWGRHGLWKGVQTSRRGGGGAVRGGRRQPDDEEGDESVLTGHTVAHG